MSVVALSALLLLAAPSRAASTPSAKDKRALSAAIRLYHRLELQQAAKRFDEELDAVAGWKTAAGFRASCRWTLGDNVGAIEDAKTASKLKPNDALSYAARGKAQLVLKNYDEALEDFRLAGENDPRSIEGPLGEGSTLSAQGKNREALMALNRAVKLDPGSAAALLMRGSVKDRLRDFHGACDDYGSLLEINQDFVWARLYRGKALRELKDYRGAEADFTIFLETNENENAHYLRSNVRFLLGDYQGASADLGKVIALNPRNGLAYSNRGQTRALLGDKDGAASDLRKALELDPQRREKIQAAIDALDAKAQIESETVPTQSVSSPRPAPARAKKSGAEDDLLFIEK